MRWWLLATSVLLGSMVGRSRHLAAVPPLIVLLYFLKLKRQPLEVPSTYLWTKAIEDLHVNSIWQRLRQSLLLFCSCCLIALVRAGCCFAQGGAANRWKDRDSSSWWIPRPA